MEDEWLWGFWSLAGAILGITDISASDLWEATGEPEAPLPSQVHWIRRGPHTKQEVTLYLRTVEISVRGHLVIHDMAGASREPDGCQLEELVTKSQPGPPDHAFLPLLCFSSAWYRFPAKLCTGFYVCLFSLEAALMGRAWARTLPLSIESTRKGEDAHLPPV